MGGAYPDDSDWFAGIVDVQVVNGTRERDGEKVGALPETTHLLVFNLGSHLELTETVSSILFLTVHLTTIHVL